uniref:Nuclear envelope pore membrane protein POM 121 n=1 Tax=Rousettus aegyptiacus TaxID=9407 RepID=A0A7J8FKZ1_ROUAE|nr:hypothetical protein HJG63_012154 [Rousettus aegyptiacus]
MGSYLSRPRSRPPSPVLPGGDRREGPDRLGPVSPARRLSPACRVHSRGRSLDLASPHCRRNHRRFVVEKGSGESQRPSLSASAEAQRGTTLEKVQDISSGQNLRSCLPPLDNPRPLKRKIPLLMPSKQDDPLILPPAPQLGYRVTTEDFDLEKKIALQWINKVLEG